jgi:hypothetical protein
MQRLVISYAKLGGKAEVLYFGTDGSEAEKALEAAAQGGDKAPALVELHNLGRPLKRRYNVQPSKEELENAKKRDADEAARQKELEAAENAQAKAEAKAKAEAEAKAKAEAEAAEAAKSKSTKK